MSTSSLTLDVYTAPSRPVARPPQPFPPPLGGWTWPPTAAVLISGERDAILVDTLIVKKDVDGLADWVEATGKNLTTIYITHDHADHYLGAAVLLRRFPKARLVATPIVVEDIRPQLTSGVVESYWKPLFGGDIADGHILPEPLTDDRIDLEGHAIIAVQTGQSDTAHSTYLHIPELSAIVAGDIAYNDVHVHLGTSDHARRMAWIETLRELSARQPKVVVAMHRRPDAVDVPECLAATIKYIQDFDRLLADGVGATELIARMQVLHPARLNLATLYNAAHLLAR